MPAPVRLRCEDAAEARDAIAMEELMDDIASVFAVLAANGESVGNAK